MCGGEDFENVIDFGLNPLVNSLLDSQDQKDDPVFPLVVKQCQKCFLVQIMDSIDADEIYQNVDYLFFSSDMPNMSMYFRRFAKDIEERFLKYGDFVVEIGSNDGVFLQHLEGYKTLGVDPATNVVLRALRKGIISVPHFFDERLAGQIEKEWGKAKVIMGANCIAHSNDLMGLMKGVDKLLSEDGVFILECNYWGDMVKNKNYNLIYHDHFSYFTLQNWIYFANRYKMRVFDAVIPPAQGDFLNRDKKEESFNIRIFIDRKHRNKTDRMKAILKDERDVNLHSLETAHRYEKEVRAEAKKLGDLIRDLKGKGAKIAGYGAAAKGFALLNLADIDERHIDYFVDDSPAKQGKFAPVSHIPIISRQEAERQLPDYFFITAPNYASVIMEKEKNFKGQFITIDSKIKRNGMGV